MGLKTEEQLQGHLDVCDNAVRSCTCCQIKLPEYVLREESFPCDRKLNNCMDLSMETTTIITTNLALFQDQIGQIAKISEDFTQKNIQIDNSVTTLLPRIEKMESYLREKMATLRRTKAMSHDPFLCYFEGIDRMILKYVPGAYRTFKHHGPIKFGNAPAGYNNDCMARHFVSWYSSAEDSDTGPGWY